MRDITLSHKAMRRSHFYVEEVLGGWGVFERALYNGRGYFDRRELLAMNRMGIHRYDESTGALIGKGVTDE